MSREKKKPIELIPVDDKPPEPPAKVLRLQRPGEAVTGDEEQEEQAEPVRLGKPKPEDEPTTLPLPDGDRVEMRSQEPGIEALMEEPTTAQTAEQAWGEKAASGRPLPWGWFVLLGLAMAAALAWSLTRVHESRSVAESIRKETESALLREQQEEADAKELVIRIESLLGAFFSVRQVGEWNSMVRHPERVMPLIRAHYSRHPGLPGPLRSVQLLQPLMIENRGNYWMATVQLAGGRMQSMVLEIDEHGNPRVDWETLVCHQPMPWNEFVRKRPQGRSMDFRVHVELDNFHSHEFSDANQWTSFRLTALNGDEPLFGYMKSDNEDLQKIMHCLENNQNGRTALILRLIIPNALQSPRGVIIEKLISPRWLYADSPSTGS